MCTYIMLHLVIPDLFLEYVCQCIYMSLDVSLDTGCLGRVGIQLTHHLRFLRLGIYLVSV